MESASEANDADTWPAVGYEPMWWQSRIDARMVSRADRERLSGPYEAAVVPRIEGLTPVLAPDTITRATEASHEIARFDSDIGHEIAPFASILLRTESASSSMIENLSSGAKAVALAELGSEGKRNAQEIVGNVRAMEAALDMAHRLDADAILRMHSALLENAHPDIAGVWRAEAVWIGGNGFGPIGAAYVAPRHESVPAAIADLMAFARRDDLPVLTQAAIAHAQFETIHPFPDGNGRTGRALVHAILRHKELTRSITVPVSAGLLADTDRYFEALTSYRLGDPNPIVIRMADAAFRAVVNGRELAQDITAVRASWDELITQRRSAAAWRVADLVLRQPVLDGPLVARSLSIPPNSARAALDHLTDVGVLSEFTGFKRNRMWQARQVLDALDAFAARAGRRVPGGASS